MGRSLIYLDANIVIRLVEGDAATRAPLEERLAKFIGNPSSLVKSRLTRMECLVKPLRIGDLLTDSQFEVFFNGMELKIIEISSGVIELATRLRTVYNSKTPDAIHLASAIEISVSCFFTGDQSLANCREVPVEII